VFITLEDEFGHIPCMVFPKVYERYEYRFKALSCLSERLSQARGNTQRGYQSG